MFIIKFIDNLFFRDSNLRAEGREGTTTNVFLTYRGGSTRCKILHLGADSDGLRDRQL